MKMTDGMRRDAERQPHLTPDEAMMKWGRVMAQIEEDRRAPILPIPFVDDEQSAEDDRG